MSRRQELIDAIQVRVAKTNTVVESVIDLIKSAVETIRSAADDEEELEQVLTDLDAQADRLAAAVAQNTTAQDEPPGPNTAGAGGEDDEPAQTGGEDSGEGAVGGEATLGGGESDDAVEEPAPDAQEQ